MVVTLAQHTNMTEKIKYPRDELEAEVELPLIGEFEAEVGFEGENELATEKETMAERNARLFKRKSRKDLKAATVAQDNAMHWRNATHFLAFLAFLAFGIVFEIDQSSISHVIENVFVFNICWTIITSIALAIILMGIFAPRLMDQNFMHTVRNWQHQTASIIFIIGFFALTTVNLWVFYAHFGNLNPHDLFNMFDLINWKNVTQMASAGLPFIVLAGFSVLPAIVEPYHDTFTKSTFL